MRAQGRDCLANAVSELNKTFSQDAQAKVVAYEDGEAKGRFIQAGVLKVEGSLGGLVAFAILNYQASSEGLEGNHQRERTTPGDYADEQKQDRLKRALGASELLSEHQATLQWLQDIGWEWKSPSLRQIGYVPYFCEYLQKDSNTPYSVFASSLDTLVSQMAFSWALKMPQEEFQKPGWLGRVQMRLK